VEAANRAGYATLAIDRLGVDASWKPPSALVGYETHIESVRLVVEAARRGDFGHFDKVVLVGHSYGTVITYMVAGLYHDVDAIVLTGGSHHFDAATFVRIVGPTLTSTSGDPRFTGDGRDPGYITTRPGTRAVFYLQGDADPAVIALDDSLAQPGTVTDGVTTIPYITLGPPVKNLVEVTKGLSIPSLTINGSEEPYFCGPAGADCSSSEALATYERQFYASNAMVTARVVPHAGHDLNLEYVAPQVYAAINSFMDRYVGR
jgi:pimeloyl-ACP methyl ester carboxylesterase